MKTLGLLVVLALARAPSLCGDSLLVISPKVGAVIDAQEASWFRLFQQYPGFSQAVVVRTGEGRYRLIVSMRDRRGMTRDSIVEVGHRVVYVWYVKITYRDAMVAGTSTPTADSAEILFGVGSSALLVGGGPGPESAGENHSLIAVPRARPDDVEIPSGPVMFGKGPTLFDPYPRLSFGAAVSTLGVGVEGVRQLIEAVESGFRGQGYSIPDYAHDPAPPTPVPIIGLGVEWSERVRVHLESAAARGDEVGCGYVMLTGVYTPSFLDAGIFRAGVGAGVVRWWGDLTMEVKYGADARISPVDSLGRYTYLHGISVSGGGSAWGGVFALTGELKPWGSPFLTAYAQFVLSPGITTSTKGGEYTMKLAPVSVGCRLSIYF